ncbi:MAG: diguanylate cyclase (GGDEF)-like protein [Psychromonas sp.]|jgi:diguanylate cyclase (GGDEF)-like protein|uniref:GGDEF domain-containing protein n=1 Tax=Psychromonas sp. TaxID=1884585 RepID=UPI0039E23E47
MWKQPYDVEKKLASLKLQSLYFLLVVITSVLIIWQYLGMNRTVDLFPSPDAHVTASGDRINGGKSISSLTQSAEGVKLHCQIKPSHTFAFCNLDVSINGDSVTGKDLSQFDDLLLWFDHESRVKDTVLVYLVNKEIKSVTPVTHYIYKRNMQTLLPIAGQNFYRLPLQKFYVPSWWILQNNMADPNDALSQLDNVITLSIATGDSTQNRTVDIHLKKVQLSGKWISAKTLYLFLLLSGLAIIFMHAAVGLYRLNTQLKLKHQQTAKLKGLVHFLKIQKNEFELLAKTDSLTGIANRAGTIELLNSLQNETDRTCSLIMFDIDYFKQVNDNYGHEIGDIILCKLAALVAQFIRETDHVARWGGEEFIVLCPGIDLQHAQIAANKLRKKIAETVLTGEISITCSFGVSEYRHGTDSIKTMFEAADLAMYKAKNNGRNRVEC